MHSIQEHFNKFIILGTKTNQVGNIPIYKNTKIPTTDMSNDMNVMIRNFLLSKV